MEKAILGFRIYKIWQILKHFAGTFRQAQTLKLGGVRCELLLLKTLFGLMYIKTAIAEKNCTKTAKILKERIKCK